MLCPDPLGGKRAPAEPRRGPFEPWCGSAARAGSYEHWRGLVYPKRGSAERWLELYAGWFDTVEVNATFYRLPPRGAARRWAEATPPGFCFAVKSSRYRTHICRLRDLPSGFARLCERIEPLREAGKLGPLLCYAYFNNDRQGFAVANGRTLRRLVGRAV